MGYYSGDKLFRVESPPPPTPPTFPPKSWIGHLFTIFHFSEYSLTEIRRLQPRDEAAMSGVKTTEFVMDESNRK